MPIVPDAALLAPVRMIKLTQQRELRLTSGCIRTRMIGNDGAGAASPMFRLSILQ
jgi:hypothetical protein